MLVNGSYKRLLSFLNIRFSEASYSLFLIAAAILEYFFLFATNYSLFQAYFLALLTGDSDLLKLFYFTGYLSILELLSMFESMLMLPFS